MRAGKWMMAIILAGVAMAVQANTAQWFLLGRSGCTAVESPEAVAALIEQTYRTQAVEYHRTPKFVEYLYRNWETLEPVAVVVIQEREACETMRLVAFRK